jgi:hypothetical protein
MEMKAMLFGAVAGWTRHRRRQSIVSAECEARRPLSLYGKRGFEFGVIVVNFIAMVPCMSNSLRRDFEVLWLASYQGNAFPTLIGFL